MANRCTPKISDFWLSTATVDEKVLTKSYSDLELFPGKAGRQLSTDHRPQIRLKWVALGDTTTSSVLLARYSFCAKLFTFIRL